jgi:hypothetical protein
MADVRCWVGSIGPYLSTDAGLRTDKVPADPLDVLRLADIGSLIKPGFNEVAAPGQGSLVADAQGTLLTVKPGSAIVITTDPATDSLTIGVVLGSQAGQACAGDDPRLLDSRPPTAHAATHAPGGSDEVKVVLKD